jgi:hypothetical protein
VKALEKNIPKSRTNGTHNGANALFARARGSISLVVNG